MAYGVLYEFNFESTNGADCLIQIQKKDYTGEVKKRKLGRSPVLKRENNNRIYGTSCEIYAECVEDGEFSQLYTSSPYEFRVEVYRNNQLLWVGFVSPELYSEPDIAPPYDVQIIATDGLGELKDYSWSRLGLTTIHNILIELLGKSGLDRSFFMVSDLTYKTESGAMSSPDDLLSIRLNLDHEEDESYYDVLQNLLASFNLNISTYKNKWILFRETDFLSKSQEIESEEFGSMLTCEYWPVGQLSVAIEPAKKSVELESPNHYRDNILDFNSWSLSNNARYSEDESAYILPPSDNPDIQSEISQTVQFEKGVAFSLAIKVKAGELGYIASVPDLGFKIEIVGAIDGAASHFYLRRSDISSGNPSTDYVLDPYEVGSLESYNTAFYETVKMPQGRYATAADAKDINIVIPLYYNSDNVFARADQLKISIFSRNQYKDIRIYEARLIKYEQTKGYKADVEINNNAREEGSDVEIPLTPGDQVPKSGELFMTGIPIQPSSNEVITLWQTQNAQEEKYLSFMAQDIARSIAQPKMKYTGTLNVPGNRYDLPLLFSRDNTYYFPKTYTLDLYNDELNVELISVSAADVSLESVVISQIAQAAGQTGGMTSGGGSTGGGYVPIPLDKEMSDISDNAVANRVIKSYVDAIGVRLSTIETYFSTTEDVDTQINKWNEIVTFLNATEGTTLAGILATYATKDALAAVADSKITISGILVGLNGEITQAALRTGLGLDTILGWYDTIGRFFKKDAHGNIYVDGDFYTSGQFAAKVAGAENGGGGFAYLAGLYDVSLASLASGDLLTWNGNEWVNVRQSSLKPDLSSYATKTFVTSQGFITASALEPYARLTDIPSLEGYATQVYVNSVKDILQNSLNQVTENVTTIESVASEADTRSQAALNASTSAISTANTAKNAVATLEGLANTTTAQQTLAAQVTQIEGNKQNLLLLHEELTELSEVVAPFVKENYTPQYEIAHQDTLIKNGVLSSSYSYQVTSPILLRKGDTIVLKCYVGSDVQAISQTDANGSYYKAISVGSGYSERRYTATDNCYVALCWLDYDDEYPRSFFIEASSFIPSLQVNIQQCDNKIQLLSQKTGVSLITASNEKVNFNTSSQTIDFTSNPLLCVGSDVYDLRAIHSDASKYRVVPYIDGTGSSAQRIIFNLSEKTLYPKFWADTLMDNEVVVGSIRIAGTLSISVPFEYTIDGKELWDNNTDEPTAPNDEIEELRKHINVSLIADIQGSKPNLFAEGAIWYLDFGSDAILLVGNTQYVLIQLHSDTSKFRKIPLNHESGTSAVKVVFNLDSATFYTKHYAETLSNSEVLIGGIRTSPYTGEPLFNFPFEYTINGQEQWETSQGSNTGDIRQLRCKTAMTFMAHRGLHLNNIPENSLDAYRYAARCGFDYAETDFQVTSDGELVLMHNESINATMRNAADYSEITGTINVSEHTLADLRENYVLASSDVRMRKPIPTLEEYFITCRNSGIFPVPEIKAFGMSNEQIKKAHDLGCAIMGEGNFGFCSFSAEYLDYARTLSEKTILCYIMSGGIVGTNNSITGNSRVSPTTWWYPTWDSENYGDYGVTLENVRRHKEAGVKVAVWTTPVSQFDNLLKKEIDCISTDDICPSIDGLVGKVATSDKGFSDFETTGYESNGRLILSAGQTCRFNAGSMWLGGYYLSIIGKGNFTISAPNLNVTISNSKTDRYIYQGLVNNTIGELTITANGDSELEFVEFSCVEL